MTYMPEIIDYGYTAGNVVATCSDEDVEETLELCKSQISENLQVF